MIKHIILSLLFALSLYLIVGLGTKALISVIIDYPPVSLQGSSTAFHTKGSFVW